MKKTKKLGVLSFGMLATVLLPQAMDSNSYTHNYILNKDFANLNTFNEKVIASNLNTLKVEQQETDIVYLSDIKYSSASVGYGSLSLDKASDGSKISLIVNGSYVTFDKGIFAHATSTLVYDVSNYNSDYKYFVTYYGVNKTSGGKGNGVKFSIYTSKDGNSFDTLQFASNAMLSTNEAGYVKIDISDVKKIKLVANDNGANGNDHSVWADSKLVKEGYKEDITLSVSEFDELIKAKYNSSKEIDSELEKLLLQRTLVQRIGTYQIKQIYANDIARKGFERLFNDGEMLRLYVMGGTPAGTYLRSFEVLGELLNSYQDDLSVEGVSLNKGVPLKVIYEKMMITLSLTHSTNVSFWINSSASDPVSQNPNVSIATRRYQIYKDMLANNKLHPYFEQLEVEEMRPIMGSYINDDEIEWLRDYIVGSGKNWRSAYQFMSYKNVNTALYRSDIFYGENRAQWVDKYKLEGYDVANVKYYPKTFMIMQIGGVCWQISNVGQTMVSSYGVPSIAVGQPSHVAYLVYDVDSKGNSTWSIWNNVSGWQQTTLSNYTGTRSYYKVRLLNGWGNQSFASGNSGSYMMVGQAALDHYDDYVKSQEKVLLGDVYASNGDKKTADKLYREALEIQSYNLDALEKLIRLHINEKDGLFGDYNKDLYDIAVLTADNLKYYPLPMYDLLRLINSNMTNSSYKAVLALLEKRTLEEAKGATSANVVQYDVCRTMANYLLGSLDLDIAKFSFDNGTISLSSMFNNANPYWDYSLDGGKNWIDVNDGNSVILTEEQLNSITSTNDILVHLIGVDYSDSNIFRIDIKESTGMPNTLYANDLENKVMDATDKMEWKLSGDTKWTSFGSELPDLSGNKTVSVRMGATGVYLASESRDFSFTTDSTDLSKSYISINHLEVVDFSSETYRTGNDERAIYAIDGNANKYWLTSRTTPDYDRYITIKLDKPMYLSMIQYLPYTSTAKGAGRMIVGNIYTSIDGVNWTLSKSVSNLANDDTMKDIIFDKPVYAQYVKIQATKSTDLPGYDRNIWMSAAMINFYADLTKSIPTAEVEYSRKETTANPVTVKLVNPSEEIKITNNNGSDTYTFTENGSFIFEFEDKAGNKGSVKATVDWIVDYSFSFDGEDPNTIILGSKYNNLEWEYSIDGGTIWKKQNKSSYRLSDEELSSLTSSNDIKIRIGEDEYTIDITDGEALPNNLYANDWENKIFGTNDSMEWKIDGDSEWTSFKDKKPSLSGNKKISVRVKSAGTKLGSEKVEFTFTDDGENDKKYSYVSIDRLSIAGYSSQTVRTGNNEPATNAIDGFRNTFWFTNRTIVDNEKYIIIKLDEPTYISKIQYIPGLTSDSKVSTYGIMTDGIVYTSGDGEHWTEAAIVSELAIDDTAKDIVFNETRYAQYVKIQATHTYQPNNQDNQFMNAAMINIFEDKTAEHETVIQSYVVSDGSNDSSDDFITHTNKDVKVRIYSSNSDITIKNNNGSDTYTFTKNGEFTFEYVDQYGNSGTYTVSVDWIDKEAPTALVKYDIETLTNKSVKVTLVNASEDIKILNNNGKNVYTFDKNGTFTFKFIDKAGNESSAVASVDWIDKEAPTAEIEFDYSTLTNKDVVATLKPSEKVKITNNDGSDTYTFTENGTFTFEFEDMAGNKGSKEVKVDWIDKEIDSLDVRYDITKLTNKDVTAILNLTDDITITNNEGKNTYVFTHNGSFTFEFEDSAGNKGIAVAMVDWIDKEAPTATFEYDIKTITNKSVTVTLKPSEEIKILNNNGSDTYTFDKNGTFTFEFEDMVGNKGSATASVDWITTEAIKFNVTYDHTGITSKNVTATLNVSEGVVIDNNDGSNVYVFTENGTFTFEYTDQFGNKGTAVAVVDWIDKKPPVVELLYSTKEYTNGNVVVKVISGENFKIVNNNGSDTYVFEHNGRFTFEVEDDAGNRTTIEAVVDWIKVKTKVSVKFNTELPTSKDVVATLVSDKDITIINNDGSNKYVFTENGTFTFKYTDQYGDTYEVEAVVSWIDKKVPTADVEYSTTKKTNKDVTVKLVNGSTEYKVVNNGGKNTYTFTKNGTFTFEIMDKLGNVGYVTAKVDWIDKEAPTAEIKYNITDYTNKDVTATLVNSSENITIINAENGIYVFTENGEYVFEFKDEAGNIGHATAKVDWIDKILPNTEIKYSTTEETSGPVIVTLVADEPITITNNGGKSSYIFTSNGTFTFEYVDRAGNASSTTVVVTWIKNKVTVNYSNKKVTTGPVIVSLDIDDDITILNNGGKKYYIFTKNGSFVFEYVDQYGNYGTITAKVDWIIEEGNESSNNNNNVNVINNNNNDNVINNDDNNQINKPSEDKKPVDDNNPADENGDSEEKDDILDVKPESKDEEKKMTLKDYLLWVIAILSAATLGMLLLVLKNRRDDK